MRSVNITELKTHLSRYLRDVRAGRVLTVLDRNTPIARLGPIDSNDDVMITQPSARVTSLSAVRLPPPAKIGVDVIDVLLADRRRRG